MPSWYHNGGAAGAALPGDNLEPSDIGGDGSLGSLTVTSGVTELSGELNYTDLTINSGTALAATAGELLWVRCTGDLDVQGALHADGRGQGGGPGGVGADEHQEGRPGGPGNGGVPTISASGSGGGGGSGGNPQTGVFSGMSGGRGGSGNPSSLSALGQGRSSTRYRKLVCPITFEDDGGAWAADPDTPQLVAPPLLGEIPTTAGMSASDSLINTNAIPIRDLGRDVARIQLSGGSNGKSFYQHFRWTVPEGWVGMAGNGITLLLLDPDTDTGAGYGTLSVYRGAEGGTIATASFQDLAATTDTEDRSHIYLSTGVDTDYDTVVPGDVLRLRVYVYSLHATATVNIAELVIEYHERDLDVDFLGGLGGLSLVEAAGVAGADGLDSVNLEADVRALLEDGFAASYTSRRSLSLLRPGAGGGGGGGGGASGNHLLTARAGGAAGALASQTGTGLGHGVAGTNAPVTSTDTEISDSGGGGASGGAGGGRLMVEVVGDVTIGGSGRISANGGDGANGGVGGSNGPTVADTSNGGSGGGSAAGSGGSVLLVYQGTSTNVTSSTVTADAGSSGSGGAAADPGTEPEQIGGAGGDGGASEDGFAAFYQVS